MSNLKAAKFYQKMGFSVIPVRKDKKPHLSWTKYQTEAADENQLSAWWKKWPAANIGLVCGQVSGVNVVDVDTDAGWQALNEFLPETLQTPICRTPGGGYHVYFGYQQGLSNGVRLIEGCDLRTDGGYVVAPPSSNGSGNFYVWMDTLKPNEVKPAPMPSMLYGILQQGTGPPRDSSERSIASALKKDNSLYKKKSSIYRRNIAPQKAPSDTVTKRNNRNIGFEEGFRDETLFHTATCLHRGGMDPGNISKILHFIGSQCSPPFPINEIDEKLNSVLKKVARSETSLTGEIRDFISVTWGNFSVTEAQQNVTNVTFSDRPKIRAILYRMCKAEGIIERVPGRDGWYRKVDDNCKPVDWVNCETGFIDIRLPFELSDIAGIQPGNIIIFAGAKDSGKTAALLNIAYENQHKYDVHYFSSEMGGPEFKLRAEKFQDITPDQWRLQFYERVSDFEDVIKPGSGKLNIIDYLEVTDNFFRIAEPIAKIHAKANGAITVIAIQKTPGMDLGRGGTFSLEKARLYVSLDYGRAKIISCKNFKPGNSIGNPRSKEYHFKLIDGCRYRRKMGWHTPAA